MTYYRLLTQARNAALWLCVTVFVAFAVFLFSGSGTAQTEGHPMRKQGYFVASENVYVPPKPDRLPALVPGQQFICLPDSRQPLPYQDATSGTLLQRSDLALKVLTLTRVENKHSRHPALRFLLEGTDRNVLLFTNEKDVTKLPGLQSLVQDDTLQRLRNKYVGKKVWVYGSLRAVGLTTQPNTGAGYDLGNSHPVIIKHLVRVYRQQGLMLLGSGEAGVLASNPLIAVLDLPRNAHWRSASFMGPPNFLTQVQTSPHSVCLGFWSSHVDDWDFERTFSLVDLYRIHPHWSHEIRLRMTPEMVAWVRGWPPEYGSMAELRKKPSWRYDWENPFSDWVYFKNGKVIKFCPDGHLP